MQNAVYSINHIYPHGSFKLSAGRRYNIVSDGSALDGKREIDETTCKLVLDKTTSHERTFDIRLLTTDSLTIWRKDSVNMVNYFQHYKRN